MKTPKLKELRSMHVDDIIDEHDRLSKDCETNVNYCLVELARRDQSKQTNWIIAMTAIVTIATIINVVVATCNVIATVCH